MTELSPAAQAVLDAAEEALSDFENYGPNYTAAGIAAALRALATCVEPVEILAGPEMAEFDRVIRASDIFTIAAELES